LKRREQTRIRGADTTADKIQFRIVDPPKSGDTCGPNQPILLSASVGAIAAAIGDPCCCCSSTDRSRRLRAGVRSDFRFLGACHIWCSG